MKVSISLATFFNHDFQNGDFYLYKNNNQIYYENSDHYWEKSTYDSNNNEIYIEDSKGYWYKNEFDSNNNEIYYEDSDGYWEKRKYDKNNNLIYLENSKNCKKSERNIENMEKVIKTEIGWGGHFCYANKCNFKRNTLLEYNNIKIVVSTVGDMVINNKSGINTYYETMAFYAKKIDIYYDTDVSKKVPFDSNCTITEITTHTDQIVNDMHESIVLEISEKLKNGIII